MCGGCRKQQIMGSILGRASVAMMDEGIERNASSFATSSEATTPNNVAHYWQRNGFSTRLNLRAPVQGLNQSRRGHVGPLTQRSTSDSLSCCLTTASCTRNVLSILAVALAINPSSVILAPSRFTVKPQIYPTHDQYSQFHEASFTGELFLTRDHKVS
ncbi:hypothetical protein L228DRAFT_144614 [Xylona heveae TC161]|uniref:Uncharacterized protein n=1 Tax=Xylona heveae (strain CBS 132557 / TC161) TaxID=1328760 RepID=A0A165GC23_XYLHT|nr:hypothetical protein L228DRAFT_144614 [Xylona heveae TC161]KZF22008.1 hypothetical protein L228DRAFT_144614 [Xylona heveae TC161]